MSGIFINYRRDDAPGVAGRLYDYLAKTFSRRELFMDVDAIKPGLDFVKQLDSQVSQCDVMLALIGPQWLGLKDEHGRQKLHGDKDYVRIEIASALRRDIPVIPVLIHGATMPAEDDLPEDLKSLARRQALELRHTRFASDADAIAAALKAALPRRTKKWAWPLAAAACLLGVAGAALFYVWPGTVPPAPISTAPAREQIFVDPMANSLPLDGCLYFARECGQAAASAWCASKGLGTATKFTGFRNVPQTYVLGDGSVCQTGPTVTCGTFTSITCGG